MSDQEGLFLDSTRVAEHGSCTASRSRTSARSPELRIGAACQRLALDS